MQDNRPVYLDLLRIRLPLTGIVSFGHRVSGVLMFLAIPFAVYLLDQSVASQQGFDRTIELLAHPVMKLAQLLLVLAFAHHLFSGIRFLLIDFDIGVEKAGSRLGSWLVLAAEALALLIFIVMVWL